MKPIILTMALLGLGAAYSQQAKHAAPAPPRAGPPIGDIPHADISACLPPADVSAQLPQYAAEQLPFFDSYSWKAFAALVCDGSTGQRDFAGPRTGDGPRIFETYKSAWEIFHAGTVTTDFDRREDPRYNPCGPQASDGALIIASPTKFVDIEEVGLAGVFFGPLPAQNHTYVHYLTQFNRQSFDYLTKVLAANTTTGINFPVGSLNVKSAWVEMSGLDAKRFYTRKAWIRTSASGCTETTVGLVGLHIVQKTPLNPNWIWSTFEQVDNAPDDPGPACKSVAPHTFHNSKCDRMPTPPNIPSNDPYAAPKNVYNVVRAPFISTLTGKANGAYQAKLANSVWKNYELVMTQWQLPNSAHTFPDIETSASAFANTVMETFLQGGKQALTCMACHGQSGSDSVWALQVERLQSRKAALDKLKMIFSKSGIQVR